MMKGRGSAQFDWSRKSVLVTGAGGFIGSHLVEELVRRGAHVRAFVRYNARGSQGCLEYLTDDVRQKLDVFAGDISEYTSLRDALAGIDIVFHLAALIGIPYSYSAPAAYVRTNVAGTLNVLQAACDVGIEKCVHTSTSEVYGTARYVPMDEAHPLQAQSPYSATKIAADALALSFHHSFRLPVAIIRPFNAYGPRQSLRAIIPTIISQIIAHTVVRLGTTQTTRDFTFVLDSVAGFLAVAESPDTIGEVVNIGFGEEISIRNLVDIIAETAGCEAMIELDSDRLRPQESEVERLCAGIEKAQKLLGWQPVFTLRQGLEQTIAWFREHMSSYPVEPGRYQT
jgi:NAD dependent epimerase/dehydratase